MRISTGTGQQALWNDWDDPDVAAVLGPQQTRAATLPEGPERRLMMAVLIDAIAGFRKLTSGVRGVARRDLLETERWIRADDRRWPCSFVNVCEALGIAHQPLRRALLRWKLNTQPEPGLTRRRLRAGMDIVDQEHPPSRRRRREASGGVPPRRDQGGGVTLRWNAPA